MTRQQARILMMQLLFSMEAQKDFSADFFNRYIKKSNVKNPQLKYMKKTFDFLTENRTIVDDIIKKHSRNWQISRITKTDLAILRLACIEILYFKDIPIKVSISEALNMAGTFGNKNSSKYVHGVLSAVTKELGYENPKK